jgi:hypothetical protein
MSAPEKPPDLRLIQANHHFTMPYELAVESTINNGVHRQATRDSVRAADPHHTDNYWDYVAQRRQHADVNPKLR